MRIKKCVEVCHNEGGIVGLEQERGRCVRKVCQVCIGKEYVGVHKSAGVVW